MGCLRVSSVLCALLVLLTLGGAAIAQVYNPIEPAFPGSIEYSLTSSNYTWVQTSDPITVGSYVLDLLSDSRWNQPEGRGAIGIVTSTGFDPDYNVMAATVDFGRDFSAGIIFPELSSVEIVSVPEPAALLALLPVALLWRGALGRCGRS